ncbi:hypothetical protein LZ32DRAFT_620922 [Colletotrichum eremochloae]|nr:hypothetical protein LZ32DRAFT_620922 [Colletotrichum eremochloae]
MQFSISKTAVAFFLLSAVSADLHESCTCHNGDSYNWRLTTKACDLYAQKNYQWGRTHYDTPSGRCVRNSDTENIAGDQWEDACRETAKTGFNCADGRGNCTADPDQVRGWC